MLDRVVSDNCIWLINDVSSYPNWETIHAVFINGSRNDNRNHLIIQEAALHCLLAQHLAAQSVSIALLTGDAPLLGHQVSNLDHMNTKMGKAGKKRYLGKKPHVRGRAMNPVDHPWGGGEGRTAGGGHPVSPWGQLAKGKKTRSPKKNSSKFIVERRKK